jgi:5-methylcytosine-specific restriction endonuclease McrA
MPYLQYLRTPEWQRTRAAALVRAGYACSLDITHTENLDVHHRTYEHRGAELTTDIVVLCRACHQLHHKEYGRPSRDQATAIPAHQTAIPSSLTTHTATPVRRRKRSLLRRFLAN